MAKKQIHTSGSRKSGYRNTLAGKVINEGTKEAMVKAARVLAKEQKLLHIIHAKDGKFEEIRSY